ncbi:DUF4270 domain-containing protein [Algibacter lectus]|uniref:DUF4270 domain-containing protein n=1 Tax=Algibacter lectus TaxID=221126 RepID=UPI0026ECB842|nr:DUF4270 domain-containing protein [Algibacter lectus]MDO7136974.1 DUF4270 domain-containing protein [Algibacter lectus]
MKKTFKALKLSAAFLFVLTGFVGCDKEFTELESAVLGKDNANFSTDSYEIPIVAYNKTTESVQVNGLASYLLGVFNDPVYGQTTASIVTQVTPSSYDPDFGDNPEITSVVLTIPYFSRVIDFDEEGNAEYTIQDSLYGDYTGAIKPFKLSIYKNEYFLRDFDPFADADDTAQKYYSYSDGSSDNMAYNGTSVINFDNLKEQLVFEQESVTPSSAAIVTVTDAGTDDEVTTRSAPAFTAELDAAFWKSLIIDKEGGAELSNANNFANYFRGLFFKAEAIGDDGSMVLLDMASTDANIVINYSYDSTTAGETVEGTYTLSFTGNTLNTFVNKITEVALADGDETNGDQSLYLKGSGNSMAVVDLFENDEAKKDFLDSFRIPSGDDDYEKDEDGNYILSRLVNDAQLVISEDEVMQTLPDDSNGNNYSHFNRVYAYDINNIMSTYDYQIDPVESSTDPFNSKIISLGQRVVDENGVYKYKIRLTEHLNNILVNDSTNTKIGLVLSTNVNYTNISAIADSDDEDVTGLPAASVITPRGTVLYGSNANVDDEKRMKFKVFYTEPNN